MNGKPKKLLFGGLVAVEVASRGAGLARLGPSERRAGPWQQEGLACIDAFEPWQLSFLLDVRAALRASRSHSIEQPLLYSFTGSVGVAFMILLLAGLNNERHTDLFRIAVHYCP